MSKQQLVQCDVAWQVLRTKTLSRYNDKGGWDTREGALANLDALSEYWMGTPYGDVRARRVYRVRSLLITVMRKYRESGNNNNLHEVVLAYHNALPAVGVVRPLEAKMVFYRARLSLEELLNDDPDMYNNVKREIGTFLKDAMGDNTYMQRLHDLMVEVSHAA